jgi:hypothetical protein
MTYFQLAALLLAGPVALLFVMRLLLLLIHGKGSFHLLECFALFVCLAVIFASFFGVKG